jgi:hypothetical protein
MVISSIVLAVVPKCPVCLMAYFGVFGVATAACSAYRLWLPPLTAVWLALTVAMLIVQASSQRRYGPALLGLFAVLAVFGGKFIFNYQVIVYVGIAALLGAALRCARVRTPAKSELCTQCDRLPTPQINEPGSEQTYGITNLRQPLTRRKEQGSWSIRQR